MKGILNSWKSILYLLEDGMNMSSIHTQTGSQFYRRNKATKFI